jgi:hypothetical protein
MWWMGRHIITAKMLLQSQSGGAFDIDLFIICVESGTSEQGGQGCA